MDRVFRLWPVALASALVGAPSPAPAQDAGSVVLGEGVRPFVAAGLGVASDPELMGTRVGLWTAVGTWVGWWKRAGLQLEARGRLLGSGDEMVELSVGVGRWLGG